MSDVISQKKIRVGIELHNLSVCDDKVVRSGIQQVVYHLLQAQYEYRQQQRDDMVEIIPLPMMPHQSSSTRFADISPLHTNSSQVVLDETAKGLGIPVHELWASDISGINASVWESADFYQVAGTLDWLVITGLVDFRFIIEEIRRTNPRIKVALLVYDLIPLILPEATAIGMLNWFRKCYMSSIFHYADLIFTISRHTAIDCEKYFRGFLGRNLPIVSSPLLSEIPSITDADQDNADEVCRGLGLTRSKYFICVGTLEPRKNLRQAILGFAKLRELFPVEADACKLLIIGAKGWNNAEREVVELIKNLRESIVLPGYLTSTQMEVLVANARALLMPSRYEGFGMPLALAQSFNVPVVTCVNSSLPEAAQLRCFFVDPHEPVEMALALRQLVGTAIDSLPRVAMEPIKHKIKSGWVQLFASWMDVIKEHEGSKGPRQFWGSPPAEVAKCRRALVRNKLKLVFDVHDLSAESSGDGQGDSQMLTHGILMALVKLRQEFSKEAEIYCLPLLPDDPFFVAQHNSTTMVNADVIRALERKIGCGGMELWGVDLQQLNYQIDLDALIGICQDSDWFTVVSQFDIRRIYRSLMRSAPNVKISHLVRFREGCADEWLTNHYIRSIRHYSSLAYCRSADDAEQFNGYADNRGKIGFPVLAWQGGECDWLAMMRNYVELLIQYT